jgi:hypothetical protein
MFSLFERIYLHTNTIFVTSNGTGRHYNELSEAFTNSKEKETLELELMKVMNDFIVHARAAIAVAASSKGHCISMLPPGSKRRKTHEKKHYRKYTT